MREGGTPAFDAFLIEDVILTLGNLRSAFAWLGQSDAARDPDLLRTSLDRLDRQLEALETRAWSLCRRLRSDIGYSPVAAARATPRHRQPSPSGDVAPEPQAVTDLPVGGASDAVQTAPTSTNGPQRPDITPSPLQPCPGLGVTPNPFEPNVSLESLLRDALGPDALTGLKSGAPSFRSRRGQPR